MRIHVSFDDELLLRYHRRGASLLFGLALEDRGQFFPDEDWLDFGVVVLDWWTVAVEHLLRGSEHTELVFMDGPFIIGASRDGEQVHLVSTEGPAFEAATTTEQLRREIARSANKALRHVVGDLGISNPDVVSLERGLVRLQGLRPR